MRLGEMDALCRIGRRQFMQMCAGSLAAAAVGCARSRERARAKNSTITVAYYDEQAMGPAWDMSAKFLIFEPLVARNAEGELEGRLAESWEHSADYRTWTIHLRKNVRWHDGVPVTAHDIKFTLGLLSDPNVLVVPPGALSVKVLDDHTYTLTYKARAIGTPLDDWTVYYPKHILEHFDPKKFYEWGFWMNPVGNGPYRFLRRVPKTMMELEANPDYFRGKPKIARVVLKFVTPSITELLSGNVDAIDVQKADLLKLRGDPRFQVYSSAPSALVKVLAWNHRSPLFREAKARRALTLAINRRELLETLNFPPDVPIFDVVFTSEQLRRRQLPEPLAYDPQEARRLLAELGWRDTDGDGVLDRNGRPFRFRTLVPMGEGDDKIAIYIQAALGKVGVQMDLDTQGWQVADQRAQTGEFEAALLRRFWGTDPVWQLRFFGENSPIGYKNPKVTSLLGKSVATMDPNEDDRIHRELMAIFQEDVPVTFLFPGVGTAIAHRRVRGLSSPWRTDPVQFMDELWLDNRSNR